MDTRGLLFGKGEKRSTEKAGAKRHERDAISTVRAHVAARDGRCRLAGVASMGACSGPPEWAHISEHKRTRTMKQDPSRLHAAAITAMLCRDGHHYAHDKGSG